MKEPLNLKLGETYGMSNGSLNEWDKVMRGRDMFEKIMYNSEKEVKDF